MSTVTTCLNKLTHEHNGNITKSTIENFNLHHNIHNHHSNNNNNNSNNNNNTLYSMNHITTPNSSPFSNDTSTEQCNRNTSLPAPHLLLQSKSDYTRTSVMLDTHNHNVNNSNDNNHSSTNRVNTSYCTSNSLSYANNSEAVNLNHCDQTLDSKQASFINTTTSITSTAGTVTHNYHNGTRGNYNYPRGSNLLTSQYDNITDSLAYNNEYINYSTISENEFGHWNSNSLTNDLKINSRSEFRTHISDTSQQLSSCVDGFPVLSTNENIPGFSSITRCLTSCPTPRHEEHTGHQTSTHITGGNHTQHHTFQSNGYCNIPERIYDNTSNSPSNLTCGQTIIHSRITGDMKNTPQVNNRSSRSASTPTRLLVVSTTSPVTSTITMTPDSSTIGFTGNKFGCSSDDGEASPTPTCSSGCPQTPGRTRKPAPTLATGRRNLKGELVDPDEADRRMKRRERNRKSAQKCRERKVQRTQELQSQVECLQLEASRLMQELDSWRSRARQCVALLQHHCPGVSVPYLSCLTEVPACLSDYKEPIDNLGDLPGQDKNMDCESQQYTWKMKSSTKTYTINETSDGIFMSNESSQLLPPMNLLHSNITSNRSKSLLTFSSNNSGKDNENQIFSQNSELNKISLVNHNNHDISGTLLIPMSRSTSKASIHGPASASSSSSSSSSSCSTYELSFPSLENHSHCLNESNTFKDYTQVNPLSIIDKRDRSRVLSGQNLLDNSPISISVKSIPVGNTNSNQQTWSLEYHETSGKKNSSMDCCSPLSPLNTITNETNTMTNHLQNNKDYPIKMDSECYTECGNSKMLNKT